MKWLGVVVVVLCVLIANGEEKRPQSNSNKKNTQSEQPSAPIVGANVINQQTAATIENGAKEHSEGYFSRLFSPENLPNIGLFIVGAIGTVVAVCTLIDIQKQTRNTRTIAEGILHSARPWAMIQFERIQGELITQPSFQFSIFNYGKTPAHVIALYGPHIKVLKDPDKNLVTPPEYEKSEWDRRFIAPRDSFPIGKPIVPHEELLNFFHGKLAAGDSVQRGYMDVVVYGMLEYTDGDTDRVYKTAFCYCHRNNVASVLGGKIIPCGPKAYSEYS